MEQTCPANACRKHILAGPNVYICLGFVVFIGGEQGSCSEKAQDKLLRKTAAGLNVYSKNLDKTDSTTIHPVLPL